MEDDENQKPTASFFRHRSPTFSKAEIKVLLSLIERHKSIVFNRATTSKANYAKDATWIKIAKEFNSQGFEHIRSADSLKTKWENLKKKANKLSKNVMDISIYSDDDDVTNQIVAMMCGTENDSSAAREPTDTERDLNARIRPTIGHGSAEGNATLVKHIDTIDHIETSNDVHWNSNSQKIIEIPQDGDDNIRLINRSLNFTPKECNLLLQCVRRERNIILSKANTANAIKIKNRAWLRVTNSYNRLSPQKRSTKVLRTKFINMKRLAKKICHKNFGKKHQNLEELNDSSNKIKCEPVFEPYDDRELNDDVDLGDDVPDVDTELNNCYDSTIDPLCDVLNSDGVIDSFTQFENKEIIKLKMDLLNYKMDTAKLQRKRIEDLIQADALEREAKSIETSLRLRTARLKAIAAEMKLPPSHPGLAYTVEESQAQNYIHQYHTT